MIQVNLSNDMSENFTNIQDDVARNANDISSVKITLVSLGPQQKCNLTKINKYLFQDHHIEDFNNLTTNVSHIAEELSLIFGKQ